MRNMTRLIGLFVTLFATLTSAQAAPLWIERKFIPAPELVAPQFAEFAEMQTQAVDHSAWGAFLARYGSEGPDGINRIGYSTVSAGDRQALRAYIDSLQATDTRILTKDQQLSFWINLYNAVTVDMILENYPTKSIRKIKKPWDTPLVTVLGQDLSLGQIEHHIVRAIWPDPRIHYALNCAALGCPNLALTPYTAATLEDMLETGAKAYVNHPRGAALDGSKLTISKIYGWYREDFGTVDDVLAHIRSYADRPLAEALANITKVKAYAYNWNLNDAIPATN